jgi:hypothetical protein
MFNKPELVDYVTKLSIFGTRTKEKIVYVLQEEEEEEGKSWWRLIECPGFWLCQPQNKSVGRLSPPLCSR